MTTCHGMFPRYDFSHLFQLQSLFLWVEIVAEATVVGFARHVHFQSRRRSLTLRKPPG